MFRCLAFAALLLSATAPAAAANLIVNGDFETAGSSDTVPMGWTLNDGGDARSLLRLDGNFYATYGAYGTTEQLNNHFLAFGAYDALVNSSGDPFTAPYLEQTFMTVAGQIYTLSYDATAFGAFSQRMMAFVMSTSGEAIAVDTSVHTYRMADLDLGSFTRTSLGFTGSGGLMSIRLTSQGPTTSSDLFVDNVSVSPLAAGAAVPEPATWAMMLGGFGLVGAALRRRAPKPANA